MKWECVCVWKREKRVISRNKVECQHWLIVLVTKGQKRAHLFDFQWLEPPIFHPHPFIRLSSFPLCRSLIRRMDEFIPSTFSTLIVRLYFFPIKKKIQSKSLAIFNHMFTFIIYLGIYYTIYVYFFKFILPDFLWHREQSQFVVLIFFLIYGFMCTM